MNTSTKHTAVASKTCMSCHENAYTWFGVSLPTRTPSKHTIAARMIPNDCKNCHTYNGGFRALMRPVMRSAIFNPTLGQLLPNLPIMQPTRGALGTTFDHQGVLSGQCKTCHDGQRASGMRARHLMVNSSCDSCHRTSSWLPAQFNHNGISPNTCQACHNGMGASAKPSGHFMTPRSCDSCHKSNSWLPVSYSHLSPAFKAMPDKLSCVSCHISNTEMIPRQMRALNRIKPIPLGP